MAVKGEGWGGRCPVEWWARQHMASLSSPYEELERRSNSLKRGVIIALDQAVIPFPGKIFYCAIKDSAIGDMSLPLNAG